MRNFIFLIGLLISTIACGQVANAPQYDSGVFPYVNFMLNSGLEFNKDFITDSSSIASRSTSSPLRGNASLSVLGTATGQKVKLKTKTLDSMLSGANCQAQFYMSGNASDYFAYVENSNSAILSANTTLVNAGSYSSPINIFFPCPSNDYVNIVIQTTANSSQFKADNFYVGECIDCGTASETTGWKDAGTITIGATTTAPTKATTQQVDKMWWRRVGDSMEIRFEYQQTSGTGGAAGSGDYLFSIPSGYTVDTAKVGLITGTADNHRDPVVGHGSFSNQAAEATVYESHATITLYNSTQFRMLGDDSSGSAAEKQYIGSDNNHLGDSKYIYGRLTVPISGWGPVGSVKLDQTNFEWTSFPSVAAGTLITATTSSPTFGTVSRNEAKYRRRGKNMEIVWNFYQTSGGTAGTGTYLFNLPPGYTIDSNSITINSSATTPSGPVVGHGYSRDAADGFTLSVIPYNSTQLYFSAVSDGSDSATVGSTYLPLSVSGQMYSITASVPISGWTENQNAPLLVGSVTSSAVGAERIERAYITNSGTCAVSSQSGSWITSISTPATGRCSLTITGWTQAPSCTMIPENGSLIHIRHLSAITSTNVTAQTVNSANADTNSNFHIMCMGPR